jgi:transcriptional regulator with XRE-family HTH domain
MSDTIPQVDLSVEVGEIFADLRMEEGWTQRQAAEKCGTSQQNIPRLEKGKQDLKLSTLQRFAKAYGYNVQIHLIPADE